MRLEKHLKNNECQILEEVFDIINHSSLLNEAINDVTFNAIKALGNKLGLNVKRSNSFFDYLSSAERNLEYLITYLTLYAVGSDKEKQTYKEEIKDILKHINKREITAFFMQMDRNFFGMTSILRHILMSVFGIEITTYNKWSSNIDFILNNLKKIKEVLNQMHPTKEEIDAVDNLERVVLDVKRSIELKEEVTGCSSGATTTDNVEKFWPKLGPTVRRRKKRKLRKLI